MLKRIWLWVKSSVFRKKAEQGKFQFPVYDLTPTGSAEDVECYSYMLQQALEREGVTNIAIAGRYGSGKSSFLKTFFNKYKRTKVLSISMAAFLEKEGELEMSEQRERLLEISILQQMFYHVTQSELPFSRFRRLARIGWCTWIKILAYALLLVGAIGGVVQPKSVLYHIPKGWVNDYGTLAYWIGVGLSLLVGAIGMVQVLKFYKKIKHCNLNFQNVELDIEKDDETSVFNRYMDEVVYFFEETGYTTVVFEDIDRFKDVQIFTKLRELNLILNRAKQIKHKPIRFLYALRDNVFTGTERVKFFDFILPIVPVIDSKSSAAKLRTRLASYVGENGIAEYDEMIHALAPYISDMRLMNNIVNEFAAYREMISKQGSGTRFLGMVIFKNFFPSEFAKLYERTDSLLVRLLARKKSIAAVKVLEIECEEEKIASAIKESDAERLRSTREVQLLYMACCVGERLPAEAKSISWKGQEDTRLADFFSTPEMFASLYGNDFSISYLKASRYYRNDWEEESCQCQWAEIYPQVEKALGGYKKRISAIENRSLAKRDEFSRRLSELASKKRAINRLTISEMLKQGSMGEDDIEDALKISFARKDKSGEVCVKRETVLLLYQLLYGGYVGENYEHFISVFRQGDTTRDDNDFETAVLENVEHPFDRRLDDPLSVAKHLGVGMFTKPAVRNLDLIEAMIRHRERFADKLEAFASSFVSNTDENQRFAIDLLLRDSTGADGVAKDIAFYVEHWKTCIDDLLKTANLSDGEKEKLVARCLIWMKVSEGALPFEVGEYIKRAAHPCEIFNAAGCDPSMMTKVLDEAGVRLEKCVFESDTEKTYLDAVRAKGCYAYGEGMLERIMAASGKDARDFNRAPLSKVLGSGLVDVISDIKENFDSFVATFYSGDASGKEDESAVVMNVLNDTIFEDKDKESFAKAQRRLIEDLSGVADDELAKRLVLLNLVAPSWQNVICAATRFGYDGASLSFFSKNRDVLMGQDCCAVEGELKKWVDWLVSTESVSDDSLRGALVLFPKSVRIQNVTNLDVSEERVRIAAECGRLEFTPDLYDKLKTVGKNGHMALAEAYPDEFVRACKVSDWEMAHDDLTRICIGDKFSDVQKMNVLQLYEGAVSDTTVAKVAAPILTTRNYKKLSASSLETLFPYLMQSELQMLVLQKLDLDPQQIRNRISQMREPYNKILDAKARGQLPSSSAYKAFLRFLIGKGLIAESRSGAKLR